MYLLTTDDILGRAELKDVTRGVRGVFGQSSVLAVEGLRDMEWSECGSHLFVMRCGYNQVW